MLKGMSAPTGDGGAGMMDALSEMINQLRNDMNNKFEESDERINKEL